MKLAVSLVFGVVGVFLTMGGALVEAPMVLVGGQLLGVLVWVVVGVVRREEKPS